MSHAIRDPEIAQLYVRSLEEYIDSVVPAETASTVAINPGHRIPFHWPPHPVSHDYHVLPSDWRGRATFESDGEVFEVEIAKTPNGVFGRCQTLWAEVRGKSEPEMLDLLRSSVEPLFKRQRNIASMLGIAGRYSGSLKELTNSQLMRLLYSSDRDVSHDAKRTLETRPGKVNLLPVTLKVLTDRRHPLRRVAQWCVLDLFEDLPAYCLDAQDELMAIQAMKELLWSAEDDFARTIYKAGVVLGGHLPDRNGEPALIECLGAPSKFGRRSAIHGLFHVVEWFPETRTEVVAALRGAAETEADSQLKEFAQSMADDIDAESFDHVSEPVFPEEA